MTAACFSCCRNPAGYPENPYSAYCPSCQPPAAFEPPGSFSACGRCREAFGTLSSFDAHQVRAEVSAVLLACTPPRDLGFAQDEHGTWQTPAGLAARERTRQMMLGVNARRKKAVPAVALERRPPDGASLV